MTAYHIQRGDIRRPMLPPGTRLSKAVSLQYMGSSEFEFGALPRSLRALQALAHEDRVHLVVEPRIQDDNGRSVRILHSFTPDEYEKYVVLMLALRDGTRRTKESTYFDKEHSARFKTLTCDFWWDIDAHVMWSFDKIFMNRLCDQLVASWQYMDEMAAKRGNGGTPS